MLKKINFVILALLVFSMPMSANALDKKQFPKTVVLVINKTSLEEIKEANLATINELIKQKKLAAGLMNSRGGRSSISKTSGYLTLGAGEKANGGNLGSFGFNENESFEYNGNRYSARKWYQGVTGYKIKKGQIVNLGIADSSRRSQKYDYSLIPGLLGKKLKEASIKRAVIGNADILNTYHREATLVAMDTTGKVDYGDVHTKDKKNSYSDTLKKTKKYLKKAAFVVVELGATTKIESRREFFTDDNYEKQKRRALKSADKFLKEILKELNLKRDRVIILSPTPPKTSILQKALLSPILVIGKNQKSFIFSSSTKWRGIANNTDFAPTVLGLYSIDEPIEMSGGALSSTGQSSDPLGELLDIEKTAIINNQLRTPLLSSYVAIIVATIILCLLLFFFSSVNITFYKTAEWLLVYVLSVPPVLLFHGAIGFSSAAPLVLSVIAVSLILTSGAFLLAKDAYKAIIFLVFLTTTFVIADTLTGSNLMRNSVLGFSPIVGARFYGIGNEYMGVIVSSVILSLAFLKNMFKWPKKSFIYFAAAVFALSLFIISFPWIGANVGGGLAASAGFVAAMFSFKESKFSWKQPVALMAALVVVVIAIMASDRIFDLGTHAGKASKLINNGGIAQAALIFKRKILANLKLLKYTAWTNVLITCLIAFPILFIKPAGAIKQLKDKLPNIWAAAIGITSGAIAAFVFNDSGVVAAATCLLYAVVIVLYVIIEEQKRAKEGV